MHFSPHPALALESHLLHTAADTQARLAAEKSASAVDESRMRSLAEEARLAKDELVELEGKAASLEGQVSEI